VRSLHAIRVFGLSATTALFLVLSFAMPATAQTATNDLVGALTACSQCDQFVALVRSAGLTDTLHGAGPFTVWAPTDAALAGLPSSTTQRMRQDPTTLRDVVRYHLAPGTITAAQIVQVPTVKTVQGESVRITAAGGTVKINEAPVVQADLPASNGIIHVIGGVLIPPSQVQALPQTGSADSPIWPTVVMFVGLACAVLGLIVGRKPARAG
jgi:LPXTG-motif cell wall-anchored protein